MATTVVFVHGWSVTNLNTYGELPLRLKNEALQNGLDIKVEEIFLGRYISFHDEVNLDDISKAFNAAVNEQLKDSGRFVCITHSTGGPAIRNWWDNFNKSEVPRLSHLIMLAPANFGSALAQLGKSKISRLNSWFNGVEPGQKVLDWLALGSSGSWALNEKWIKSDGSQIGPDGVFPFVLIGQSIDRKLFDHLNSYTGELGSDGVVRAAAANLNSTYIKLIQEISVDTTGQASVASQLTVSEYKESPTIPFRLVRVKSHSGTTMGIMSSVSKDQDDLKSQELVRAIFDCIKVTDQQSYSSLIEKFTIESSQVQADELIEEEKELFVFDRHFIHDRFSQVVFRVTDTDGISVTDFDLIFTAGEQNDANHLPHGFAIDRQQNKLNPETVTYFFNYDVMVGAPANKYRDALPGTTMIGLKLIPRPDKGFVRYVSCEINATTDLFDKVLKPNATTLIDIVLQRVISKEVFRLEKLTGDYMPSKEDGDFKNTKSGTEIVVD